MNNLPNFLVIGVAKSGTTALYHHLQAHPEVYMSPVKEPNFFSYEGQTPELAFKPDATITRLEDYYALFEGARGEKAIGEASPRYFHSPVAPARIRTRIPDARLIALLRHPVERAFSQYMMMLNAGAYPYRPFEQVFREKARSVETWDQEPLACYGFKLSFYYDSLKRYFDCFSRDQIRIYLFEEYVSDPRSLLSDLFRFLDVDTEFVPDLQARFNPTHGVPKSMWLQQTVMRPNWLKTMAQSMVPTRVRKKVSAAILRTLRTSKPVLDDEVRRKFAMIYRDDILKVQDLLGRDLSVWLR
ncbi:MAG: sulfotransferase [Rhodothermales bacterium]